MNFIDMLSVILPVLAFICVLLILSLNLYAKLRPNRLMNVNCWFCNQWSKVSYELKNSWDCPFCEQYNGFTKDGDYNKPIPEQHDELMNKVFPSSFHNKSIISDNGLCSTCNNNQQLKIQQLAMFSPIEDSKFDEEIERYEKQLERAYRLCPQCELTVKRTLHKQKSILLSLRLSTLREQGMNILKFNKSIIMKTAKRRIFLAAINYTTVVLAVIQIFEILKSCDFSHKNIINSLPDALVPYTLLARDFTVLSYNFALSLLECLQYLQGFVLNYIHPQFSMQNNFIFHFIYVNRSAILPPLGLFFQFIFLLLNQSKIEFAKCVAWFLLTSSNFYLNQFYAQTNVSPKLVSIVLYFFVLTPSSTKKPREKQSTVQEKKNEFPVEEECDKNVELLNSTFKSHCSEKLETSSESNKFTNLFNNSTNSVNLFTVNKRLDDNLHVFGQQPVFENPLNTSYSLNYRSGSNDSLSTMKTCTNDSSNTFYYAKPALPSTENSIQHKSPEQDLYKGLSDLHLDSNPNLKKFQNDESPLVFRVSTPSLTRPKPVLSPPRLCNITQSSWVAGGYWKPSEFTNNFGSISNLSRSSSQSSGFGSQASSQQPNNFERVFSSLPSSRTNSVCGEFDKFSVLSEPAYQYNNAPTFYHQNRFYPTLRPDQQLYIYPKSPTNSVLNENFKNFAYPGFNSHRPSSRESNFIRNAFNTSANSVSHSRNLFSSNNPFYSHTSDYCVKNSGPISVNPINASFSQPYEKGSLLKKWRDQSTADFDH